MIDTTTSSFTSSGLASLDLSQPCLFVSNHRDIALDPAFVNWALHMQGQDTVRIAVGDNLLRQDWIADLIRLNKCFIVNRSAESRREKLAASKLLSEYIYYSLREENQHIWIAQREGRAKDGNDLTNAAIISMLSLNKNKEQGFGDYIASLRIVPVSISYEFDPCDESKATELHQTMVNGSYDKQDHEDIKSITDGITGRKGHVHLHFGNVLKGNFEQSRDVASQLDHDIQSGYRLFATNVVAAQMLQEGAAKQFSDDFEQAELRQAKDYLQAKISGKSEEVASLIMSMYAAPLLNKLKNQA